MICNDKTAQERGYAKFEIDGLPSLDLNENSIERPSGDHAVHFCYKRDEASAKANQSARKPRLKFPKLPLPETTTKDWMRAELMAFVEETLKTPPDEAKYIIGNQSFPYPTLSPGQKLKQKRWR